MYCRHCGSRLADGAAFCASCGEAVAPDGATRIAMRPVSEAEAGLDASGIAKGPYTGGRVDWTLGDVGLGVLCFLALFLVIPIPFVVPFAAAFGDESTEFFAAALIASACSEVGLVATAAFFTFRKYGGSWPRLGFRAPSWSTVGYAVGAVVLAFILSSIYGLLIEVLDIDALKSERDDQLPNEVLDRGLLLAFAGITTIAFAPICEETFFRGFILPGLSRRWGIVLGILASSAVFSLAHIGPNLHKTLVPILIIGIVLGFAYYRSGNLLASIGAHLLFNSIAFTFLALSDPEDSETAAALYRLFASMVVQ